MMSEENRDLYAPPRSEVEVSPSMRVDGVGMDKVLRWVGAGCLVVWMVISKIVRMERWQGEDFLGVMLGLGMLLGFLLGGRRWHAVLTLVALLGVVSVVTNWVELVRYFEEQTGVNGSLLLGCHLLSNAVTVGCGVALLVRGRKRG